MEYWEYKIVEAPQTEKELNILGSTGWELVSMGVSFSVNGDAQDFIWVFKRERKR